MNNLKEALERRCLTWALAARLGAPYQTIYKQYKGDRNVGVRSALLYESVLGIPRSELRPDLWPPVSPSTPTEPEESHHACTKYERGFPEVGNQ